MRNRRSNIIFRFRKTASFVNGCWSFVIGHWSLISNFKFQISKLVFQFSCFLVFSFFHFPSSAQPILDQNEFPTGGLSYERWYVWGAGAGNAGPNEVYDFSTANIFSTDTMRYMPASATPFAANHPGATVAVFQPNKDISFLWYYSSDNNAFWISGATLIGKDFPPSNANYYPDYTDTLLSTDYTFGHSETEIGAIRFVNVDPVNNPGLDLLRINFKYIVADGYGTLKSPMNQFNDVLRVKYFEIHLDTVYSGGVPIDFWSDTVYYFKYFAKGIRHPVVTAYCDSLYTIWYAELLYFPPVIAGCMDSASLNFNPMATVDDGSCLYCSQMNFSVSPDTFACAGDSVTITATGGGSYLWSTGDTVQSISVSPIVSTVYSVFISQSASCWEQGSAAVDVYDSATAGFWVDPADIVANDTLHFINTSSGAIQYSWSFDDAVNGASAEKNPKHKYSSGGAKDVMLIAFNSCYSDTFYFSFSISTGLDEQVSSDSRLAILQNPSNRLTVTIHLDKREQVELSAFDITGKKHPLIENSNMERGNHRISFEPEENFNSPGVYIIQLTTGESVSHQKWIKY